MAITPQQFVDDLVDLLVPPLVERVAERLGIELPAPSPRYDDNACSEYVSTLGERVVYRARSFFRQLAEGEVDSLQLVELAGTGRPTNIPSYLMNSLKQRAAAMRRPLPFEVDDTGVRTIWRDLEGNAARLAAALDERASRYLGLGDYVWELVGADGNVMSRGDRNDNTRQQAIDHAEWRRREATGEGVEVARVRVHDAAGAIVYDR